MKNSCLIQPTPCLRILLLIVAFVPVWTAEPCRGDERPVIRPARVEPAARKAVEDSAARSPRKRIELPGIVLDLQKRCVDLEAVVCLDRGFLELVACTKGSKEHESIVAITARPMHIHTALLLLGADNGHRAMRKQITEKETRWVNVPPKGDPIEVLLVIRNADGQPVERAISDFVVRSSERVDEVDGEVVTAPQRTQNRRDKKAERLPGTFTFAGSRLRDNGPGPRQYLADTSGNVISIATFGDEVLCLPFHETQEDSALMWHIKPGSLPKVGTKVTLRLRPKQKSAKPNNAEPAEASLGKPSPADSAVDEDKDE